MREDIKKKFLNILFEPDEVERHEKVVAKAPLQDVKPKKVEVIKEVKPEVKPSVQVKKRAFIDLENNKEEIDIEVSRVKEKINDKDYQFTQNISPIFGVVDEPKKNNEPKVFTDDSQTSKPSSSYLGTIISPIFGYDADKSTKTFDNYVKDNSDYSNDNQEPFEDTTSFESPLVKEEVIDDNPYASLNIKEETTNEERIDDIVDIEPQDDFYSSDDEQLFKELSISDIFKTDDENKENNKEDKVSYTSIFDNKED